uniref:Homeobox domain-containing protein n=1 Tax=Steinernema glaseri TaxID=37863 RepID=A0A1I7YNA1_9BILA
NDPSLLLCPSPASTAFYRELFKCVKCGRPARQLAYPVLIIPSFAARIHRRMNTIRAINPHEQLRILNRFFDANKYLTKETKELISRQTRLTTRQVKIWFQNQRYKTKKAGPATSRPSSPAS